VGGSETHLRRLSLVRAAAGIFPNPIAAELGMSVTDASAVIRPPTRPVSFIGSDREFWRILLRGALLLMVTLGLYRFWLTNDIRRFLWANTEIDGRPLEYSGTAIELLHGFLVAFAIILPIYTLYFITALELSGYSKPLTYIAIAILVCLSQYGIYLARRYRLTRTVFRGLRFHQTGSALDYSIHAVFWWGLTALTLGFAYPFARAALERFKLGNTFYGDLQGRFEADGWSLFVRIFPMWLAVLVPALVTFASLAPIRWTTLFAATRGSGEAMARIVQSAPAFADANLVAIMAGCICLILIALLLPAFHAMSVRWWISGIRFGEIAAVSHLRTRDVYAAYLRFAGWALVFALAILIAIYFAFDLKGLMFDGDRSKASEIATVLMVVGFYIVSAFGLITLYQTMVRLQVWRHAADTLELAGYKSALAHVHAVGDAGSPLGEGIADVLNVGGL
jgi:uncharacterized membrane protein YjgN (DUF898 family)